MFPTLKNKIKIKNWRVFFFWVNISNPDFVNALFFREKINLNTKKQKQQMQLF